MTGPEDSHGSTRPISVAELLARNGTIGAPPVGGRRRRRRGNTDSVTVAELTGEIPIVTDHDVDETETTRTIPAVTDAPRRCRPTATCTTTKTSSDEVERATSRVEDDAAGRSRRRAEDEDIDHVVDVEPDVAPDHWPTSPTTNMPTPSPTIPPISSSATPIRTWSSSSRRPPLALRAASFPGRFAAGVWRRADEPGSARR